MKKAFTLIELLVVIAIIAILAAILFPVFAQAKVAAKKTQSLSNIKQMGTAQLIYSADYEDVFPLAIVATHNPALLDGYASSDYAWQNEIQPYAKSWQLAISPLSPYQRSDPKASNDVFFNYGMTVNGAIRTDGVTSFGDTYYSEGVPVRWNGVAGAFNDLEFWGYSAPATKGAASLSQTAIARVADQILLADAFAPDMWATATFTYGAAYSDNMMAYCWTWPGQLVGSSRAGAIARVGQSPNTQCSFMRRYGGQTVVTFADTHAGHKAIKEVYKIKTLSDGVTKVYDHLWPAE